MDGGGGGREGVGGSSVVLCVHVSCLDVVCVMG